ncbi:MAG: UDP-3-O-acyl-N-acetylglucosamine deacetylase, partial [Tepidisphaeraceae bacterium]
MAIERQKTVGREVSFSGRGLFSGETATVSISPAEADSGITFIRDQDGKVASISAMIQNVLKRPRRTCLKNGTLLVETVEHCMAALSGMGVDNAVVRVKGGRVGELPAGDGSSSPFVDLLEEAGIAPQEAPLKPLVIRKPEQISIGDATLAALPGPTDKLEIIYDFEAPAPLGKQVFRFTLDPAHPEEFAQQVAPARTWVFEHEANELQSRGLGIHLTPKDLLVISPTGPIDNAFRFADECVRHKVLDLIGDLYLLGRPLRGRLVAHKIGHEQNHMLVRKLLQQEENLGREALVHRDAAWD